MLKLDGDRAIEEIIDKATTGWSGNMREKSRYLKMSASWQGSGAASAAGYTEADDYYGKNGRKKKKNSLYQKIQASGMELSMDESFLIAAISMPADRKCSRNGV